MKLLAIPLFELYDNAARLVLSDYLMRSFQTNPLNLDMGLSFQPFLICCLGEFSL